MSEQRQERLVGSVFGLESTPSRGTAKPSFIDASALLTATAASAIYMVLEREQPSRIWLPSYLCPVLLDAADAADVPYVFYEVDEGLVTPPDALAGLKPTDAILVIHYFGFRNPLATEIRRSGHIGGIIEDATQALLTSDIGDAGDYLVYSPRKFLGVPDGGVLLQSEERRGSWPTLAAAPRSWWRDQHAAALLRRDFDIAGGGTREWFRRSQRAQHDHPIGRYRMSDLSEAILCGGFDYEGIAERRRDNYLLLSEELAEIAVRPELPAGAVPIGFPIRTARRDVLRTRLFEHNIYPPIHWRIDQRVPRQWVASQRLARRILTLPCDQRYSATDMDRIASIVKATISD